MLWLLDFFRDPRYRIERITWILVVPGIVVMLAVTCIIFYFREAAWREAELARRAREEAAQPAPTPVKRAASAQEQVAEAAWAFDSGKVEEAKELLAGVDLEKLASPEAWSLAARVQASGENPAGGIETFTRAITATPSSELYYRRALLYRDTAEFDNARKDLEQAAALEPNNPIYPNERLLLLLQMGRKDQVKAEVTSIILSKAEPRFWVFGLAGLALENKQFGEAAELLTKARALIDEKSYRQLLSNPTVSRHQGRSEIYPLFISNATGSASQPSAK